MKNKKALEKGNLKYLIMGIGGLIILTILVFIIVSNITPVLDVTTSESDNSNILINKGASSTLSLIGDGITSSTATRKNNTWLSFDGVNDKVFISDSSYVTISYWVNDTNNNWIHVVNTSGILYEDGNEVDSLTLYSYYKNDTGWFIGQNASDGFFKGNIDLINFYNDTINETIVDEVYADGR